MGWLSILMVCVKMTTIFFQFLYVQVIEQVYSTATDIEEILWKNGEKYWQSQLFTTTHGTNSLTHLYCSKRKGYRK